MNASGSVRTYMFMLDGSGRGVVESKPNRKKARKINVDLISKLR